MATHNSSLLNSQHVKRRKNNYPVQGSSALQGLEQRPISKNRTTATKIPPSHYNGMRTYTIEEAPDKLSWIKKINLSPTILLVILSGAAILFFSLYALMWNYDVIEIKASDDDLLKQRLLSYATANSNIRLPTDDYIFNVNETFTWQNYVVKRGDNVSKIASDHFISIDAVIASNNMSNARSLREGEILRLPNMDGIPYTVASGDSLKKIADNFNVPLEAILDANDIQNDNIKIGTVYFIPGAKMKSEDLQLALGELFVYPVTGRLSSSYGWRKDPFTGLRRYHRALDLSAPLGTPVKASMAGKVTTVSVDDTYGNYVIITHSGGFQSMYAHLKTVSAKQGASIRQGEPLGEVGSTGHSTGAHLHFAIYKNNAAVNPLDYLK
ncbi:peptidoglycan-binding protein LysM [Spirochaetia bacterium]|nr:peptidoglycan-binding protein LysM [Spirochaetia bacterium]